MKNFWNKYRLLTLAVLQLSTVATGIFLYATTGLWLWMVAAVFSMIAASLNIASHLVKK